MLRPREAALIYVDTDNAKALPNVQDEVKSRDWVGGRAGLAALQPRLVAHLVTAVVIAAELYARGRRLVEQNISWVVACPLEAFISNGGWVPSMQEYLVAASPFPERGALMGMRMRMCEGPRRGMRLYRETETPGR